MPNWEGDQAQFVDLEEVLDATTLEVIRDLVQAGALVSLGTSKDGGSLSVHIKAGDIKNREWFRHSEELHDWLRRGLVVVVGDLPSSPSNVRGIRGS